MVSPARIIEGLEPIRWNGLRAPCFDASFSWQNSLAPREYPYVDDEAHDDTGRGSIEVRARLRFGNMIREAAIDQFDLFPDLWERWRPELSTGKPGRLAHPVLGEFDARVVSVSGELVAQKRDGIDVEVVWRSTLIDPTQPLEFTLGSVTIEEAAVAADEACEPLGIVFPDGEGDTSLLELVGQFEGALFSASLAITGKINQALGGVDKMISAVQALDAHTAGTAYDALTTLWAGLFTLSKKAGVAPARGTTKLTTASDTTFDALARSTGNKFTELVGLNLSLTRSPTIPKGTSVTYYA